MARKLAVRKTLRETLEEHRKAEQFWAAMTGKPLRDMEPLPEKRTRKPAADKPVKPAKPPVALEAEVMQAIGKYLSIRKDIAFCVRQNSGAAVAASGAPIYFYRWVRGKELRITDFWGLMTDGRMLAIEAKRPNWKHPVNTREIEQKAFIDVVRAAGGIAGFATCVEDVIAIFHYADMREEI